MTFKSSRRTFIKTASLASMVAVLPAVNISAEEHHQPISKKDHLTFLFQGDSITDGNRGRNTDPNHILGHGYAFSIASKVGATFPEKKNLFVNRGISGNKVTDLAGRWLTDTLEIKPDVLSLLVGVNDTASVVNQKNIVSIADYKETYSALIRQTRQQLPDCLVVLCEPFILPVGKVKDNWDLWHGDMLQRQSTVADLANEYNAVLVPLQKVFTDACSRADAGYWIWDGIHPTYSGHALITKAWLKEVGKQLPFLNKTHF